MQQVQITVGIQILNTQFSIQMVKKRSEAKWSGIKCHLYTGQPDHVNTRQMNSYFVFYVLVH